MYFFVLNCNLLITYFISIVAPHVVVDPPLSVLYSKAGIDSRAMKDSRKKIRNEQREEKKRSLKFIRNTRTI